MGKRRREWWELGGVSHCCDTARRHRGGVTCPSDLTCVDPLRLLLFTGPVGVLRDAPVLAWQGRGRRYQEPHLVWPEDQAWCLACEVDEEIEFTVGCTNDAAHALIEALPGAVRRVAYGDAAPMYRDPA
jgi:hypothetical protein